MDETDKTEIQNLFDWIIDPTLAKIRSSFTEISPTINQNLVISLLKLFKAMLHDFADPVFYAKLEITERLNIIDRFFIFSLYWSLGASCSTKDRKYFDIFVRKLFDGQIPGYKALKKIKLPKS